MLFSMKWYNCIPSNLCMPLDQTFIFDLMNECIFFIRLRDVILVQQVKDMLNYSMVSNK